MTTDATAELRRVHALRWQDADAAANYRFRATYPPETFDILLSLLGDAPRNVLDVGCGTGNLARRLAPLVDRVDAVDVSREMIAAAHELPDGDRPNIHWQVARAEQAVLDPPYGLVVGGESLHWIDPEVALRRFASVLAPGGMLAVTRPVESDKEPWDAAVREVIVRYSTGYAPFNMIAKWERAGLFQKRGERETVPVMFEQSVEDFIAAFHAMSSLTRAHIDADTFDHEVREIMLKHCPSGIVRRPIRGHVIWGEL